MPKLILFAVLALLLPALSGADTITATATVTPAQKARLAKLLARINATNCAAASLPPACTDAQAKAVRPDLTIYPDLDAWASDVLKQTAKSALQNQQEVDKAEVGNAFDGASPADQAKVKAALGLQ